MTTEAQIEANKQNAQLSTGPKNSENTKFNAVKHGLCSKKFMTDGDKEEFNIILQDLIDDLNPQSIIELRIVETMALWLWERQRVIWADFASEFNNSTENAASKLEYRQLLDLDSGLYVKEPTKEDLKKAQELRNSKKRIFLSGELYLRYKIEAENRFYKALKIWKEMHT